jgi:peptidoglycan/xylan/chitin deacetylase (PgdA/CDA1 family)
VRGEVLAAVLVVACARGSAPSEPPRASPAALTSPSPKAEASALRVALTFDDLGATESSSKLEISESILQALRAARAPAAVFANCQKLEPQTLRLWQQAGATIGNHTATHLSVDTTTDSGEWASEAWWQDVSSCHQRLGQLLEQPVRYFRFPYLHYGKSVERRLAATRSLDALGYRIAHVSAATSEWLLAQYYEAAAERAQLELMAELSSAYVEHMLQTLSVAREMARQKLGRELPQITLIHVNRLAAEHLPRVIAALREARWEFVSLEQALADPAYSLADEYAGGCGCSWLARIAPALKRGDEYPFGDFEEQIRTRFEARILALGK